MGRKRGRKQPADYSLVLNKWSYLYYYRRLMEIATSSIEWVGMPEEIDQRFLEHALATRGMAVFYRDEVMGAYIALTTMTAPPLNIYNVPMVRTAFATNGYQYRCDNTNSVLIFNNYAREPIMSDLEYYAAKLYNIDRTIDINVNGQKTPILLTCDESERLALENMYLEYDGNAPVIKGYKGLDRDAIKAIETPAEYIADKLYDLKLQVWNEALTFLGVANTTQYKRERVIQSEIETSQGQVIANRNVRIRMREQACERINRMFGLDVHVQYYAPRYDDLLMYSQNEESGDNDTQGEEDTADE